MFVVPYILVTNVFILVQLNIQFIMLLKNVFAQHVSDVTASIIRSITVVFHSHRFLVSGVIIPCELYWCWATSSLCHGQFVFVLGHIVTVSRSVCIGVGPHRHCVTVSLYLCWAPSSLCHGQFQTWKVYSLNMFRTSQSETSSSMD
jgi:hypothetical protein